MNNQKQKGFKPSYAIVALVIALLVALLFVDFGNNGAKIIDNNIVSELVNTGYDIDDDGTIEENEHASYIYFKNGKGYIVSYNGL